MSFGGAVSAMVTTLKNNKIPKRERKLGNHEYVEGVPIGKPLRFSAQMSSEEISALGEKIKKEQQVKKRRDFILYTLILSITLSLGVYFITQ